MARLDVFHADQGHDIASLGRLDFLAIVGVHFDQAANPLGLAGKGIEDGVALLQLPRVNTGKGERPKAIVHDLKGQRPQGFVGICIGQLAGGVALQIDFRLGRHF